MNSQRIVISSTNTVETITSATRKVQEVVRVHLAIYIQWGVFRKQNIN